MGEGDRDGDGEETEAETETDLESGERARERGTDRETETERERERGRESQREILGGSESALHPRLCGFGRLRFGCEVSRFSPQFDRRFPWDREALNPIFGNQDA